MLAFQRILQIMMVQNHKKLFKELPDMSPLICGSVYPLVHSFYEELESMKIFVGIQTNCYANTNLWCRMLSAGKAPTAHCNMLGLARGQKMFATYNRQSLGTSRPGRQSRSHNSKHQAFRKKNQSRQTRSRSAEKNVSFSFHTPTTLFFLKTLSKRSQGRR